MQFAEIENNIENTAESNFPLSPSVRHYIILSYYEELGIEDLPAGIYNGTALFDFSFNYIKPGSADVKSNDQNITLDFSIELVEKEPETVE